MREPNLKSEDYYEILGLEKNCSKEDVKKAYKRLAIKYHPDKNPGNKEEAEECFKTVAEACSVLSDDEQRKKYDAYGKEGPPRAGPRSTRAHPFFASPEDFFSFGSSGFPRHFFSTEDAFMQFENFFGTRDLFGVLSEDVFSPNFGAGFGHTNVSSSFGPGFGRTNFGSGFHPGFGPGIDPSFGHPSFGFGFGQPIFQQRPMLGGRQRPLSRAPTGVAHDALLRGSFPSRGGASQSTVKTSTSVINGRRVTRHEKTTTDAQGNVRRLVTEETDDGRGNRIFNTLEDSGAAGAANGSSQGGSTSSSSALSRTNTIRSRWQLFD